VKEKILSKETPAEHKDMWFNRGEQKDKKVNSRHIAGHLRRKQRKSGNISILGRINQHTYLQ